MVPEEHRERAAVRAQRLGEGAAGLFGGAGGQPENAAQLNLHGKVTGGENVWPTFGEQQVDFG